MEEIDGVSSTQTVSGSYTVEDTQNTTVLVQMEEEERVIRTMPFVTTLAFVRGKNQGHSRHYSRQGVHDDRKISRRPF